MTKDGLQQGAGLACGLLLLLVLAALYLASGWVGR